MTVRDAPVVIVGAGLAGLACAVTLHEAGIPVIVLEAADGVGGRVRTDHVDGFTLDRGFQVILTAYPELQRFDVDGLDLQTFEPGALVWRNGKGYAVSDPFRRPSSVISTALAPIGSPADKLRIAWLRRRTQRTPVPDLLSGPDVTTADWLRESGFSTAMMERFFRPLVGGIQLDPDLLDSRRMFDVIFRMLADGEAAVPAAGMQALPEQLAARLPADVIRLNAPVRSAQASSVAVDEGDEIPASAVVVATDGVSASDLLGLDPVASKAASCVYFAADRPPTDSRMVVLDGSGAGPVLNVAVMSNVAPTYAPAGKHLIAAAIPGQSSGDVESLGRRQLRDWWGPDVDGWDVLGVYRIPHGQPGQAPPFKPKLPVALPDGRFVCGDHRDTASIQGALYSGRRCAEAIITTRS